MKTKQNQISVSMPENLMVEVVNIADKEKRSIANTMRLLVEEALQFRSGKHG